MNAIEVSGLSYSYGRVEALHDVSFTVPDGALYALLGPNGSGKTTLLQLLTGLRHASAGRMSVLGTSSGALTLRDRTRVGYIAEGQPLPAWMRLEQLESYLAPLYPTWDRAMARELRERFALDPHRKISTLSRGEHMKAALLCALAPRPQLLLMDEPFTGMDALVKDDLVRGLLDASGSEGWTVLISSHDIGELELLADWVGFLQQGQMRLSEPMDRLRERFKRVTVVGGNSMADDRHIDAAWLAVQRAGRRLSFVVSDAGDALAHGLRARFPDAERVEIADASLREIFVALARPSSLPALQRTLSEEAA